MFERGYTDALDSIEQIQMEEKIAAYLLDHPECEVLDGWASEMGREILYMVLEQFRPDLLE